MLNDYDRQIEEAREAQLEHDRLQRHLGRARESLQQAEARLAELEATLEREGQDVRRLEGLSLAGLFYTVLGSKEDQLDQERQEHLAARLKRDEAEFAVSELRKEVEELERQLRLIGDPQRRYQAALESKEAWLVSAGGQPAQRLAGLSEEVAETKAAIREVSEALNAGQAAARELENMVDSLQSASNWGVWDMVGGGMLVTAAKHSRIDDARASAHRVQALLRRFQRELADVQALGEEALSMGSFEAFADFFFDSLITDWIVQSRINRSLEEARSLQREVNELVRRLERELAGLKARLEARQQERMRLLENR